MITSKSDTGNGFTNGVLPIYVTTSYPGYEGWGGILNGIVHKTNLSGTIVSVSIAPPPFDKPLIEVYLPIRFVKEIKL